MFSSATLLASDTPAPPDSPLRRLVGQLARKEAGKPKAEQALPTKEELLLPEYRFKPAKGWLLLPELAQSLSSNEEERKAVYELLDKGTKEARRLLATEGAENDVVAATALFMTQLWQFVREKELPDEHTDRLHAQLVAALPAGEIARMSYRDKQRYWEYCIGFPIFVLGMREVVSEESAIADLRTIASAGFETLLGFKPELVDIGAEGLVIRPGVLEAAAALEAEKKAPAKPAPAKAAPAKAPQAKAAPAAAPAAKANPVKGARDTYAAVGSVSGITYAPPQGWEREDADWATIYRSTLVDLDSKGNPVNDSERRHAANLFVLPARAPSGTRTQTFDTLWREQFDAFGVGDTIVHYRGRLRSGLVVYYMGRFFSRPNAPERTPKSFGMLYLVELGDRVQPIVAIVNPGVSIYSMMETNESEGFRALSVPLLAFLDSITPESGEAPYPRGAFFTPADLMGDWTQSTSVFGGFYVNAVTGAGAGAATHSSGGHLYIRPDGTYDYAFGYSTYTPGFGSQSASEKHDGTYSLDGDIFISHPRQQVKHLINQCIVGTGWRKTAEGMRRIMVTVRPDANGTYYAPALMTNWDSYSGIMNWYQSTQ